MVENKERLSQLCEAMLNEASVYVKGKFLKEIYPNDSFENEELFEVHLTAVNVNNTVNLFYADEMEFCDDLIEIDEHEVYLTKE